MPRAVTVILIVVLLLAVLAALAWYWTGRPMYVPGAVADRDDLAPLGSDLTVPLSVAPDTTLHAFSEGSGPLALVVHGGPGFPPAAPWPGLSALSAHRTFLYYHQRGCGQSSRPIHTPDAGSYQGNAALVEGALGIGQQLADIERIRRLSGQERITLVGHSYGAFLAALYAAEFPEAVDELILIAPAALLRLPSEGDLFAAVRARLPAERQPDFDAFRRRYLDFSPALFTRSDADLAALNAEFGDWYQEALAAEGQTLPTALPAEAGGWMVWAAYLSMGRRHDYTGALGAVAARTLILHAGADLQPLSVAEGYRDAIPSASLVVLDGAGHFPQHNNTEALAAALRAFWSL